MVVALTVVTLAQTLVNVSIGIYYQINKEYISQQLCENKNNPQLHCNGHCFLSKQLKKAEAQGQKQAQKILKEKVEIIADKNMSAANKLHLVFISSEFPPYIHQLPLPEFYRSPLKPPNV